MIDMTDDHDTTPPAEETPREETPREETPREEPSQAIMNVPEPHPVELNTVAFDERIVSHEALKNRLAPDSGIDRPFVKGDPELRLGDLGMGYVMADVFEAMGASFGFRVRVIGDDFSSLLSVSRDSSVYFTLVNAEDPEQMRRMRARVTQRGRSEEGEPTAIIWITRAGPVEHATAEEVLEGTGIIAVDGVAQVEAEILEMLSHALARAKADTGVSEVKMPLVLSGEFPQAHPDGTVEITLRPREGAPRKTTARVGRMGVGRVWVTLTSLVEAPEEPPQYMEDFEGGRLGDFDDEGDLC